LPGIYNTTREEQVDGLDEECWEESNKSVNIQLFECLEPHVPPASTKEAANKVCTTIVLREPPFKGHSIDGGTETGGDAGAPKAVHRNRKTAGFHGDCWVGYARQVRVTTVQQLVKE